MLMSSCFAKILRWWLAWLVGKDCAIMNGCFWCLQFACVFMTASLWKCKDVTTMPGSLQCVTTLGCFASHLVMTTGCVRVCKFACLQSPASKMNFEKPIWWFRIKRIGRDSWFLLGANGRVNIPEVLCWLPVKTRFPSSPSKTAAAAFSGANRKR